VTRNDVSWILATKMSVVPNGPLLSKLGPSLTGKVDGAGVGEPRYVGIAVAVDRHPEALVVTGPAHEAGVVQGGASGVQLRHEGVVWASVIPGAGPVDRGKRCLEDVVPEM